MEERNTSIVEIRSNYNDLKSVPRENCLQGPFDVDMLAVENEEATEIRGW